MAHTVKAYISPTSGAITMAEARERERPGKAARAQAEVARILADVERGMPVSWCPPTVDPMSVTFFGRKGSPTVDGPAMRAALAESLAAFVNAPVQA